MTGVVHLVGGNVDQPITSLNLQLQTLYRHDVGDNSHYGAYVLARYRVTDSFVLNAGERRDIPFACALPLNTPVTTLVGGQRFPVVLKTGVDIPSAVDPNDTDRLAVEPTPLMGAVLRAMRNLGFHLVKTDVEYATSRRFRTPIVQEFEFRPSRGFAGKLKEVELVFLPQGHHLTVMLELDRRVRAWGGLVNLDMPDRSTTLTFAPGSRDIESVIERAIRAKLR
ncbi:MAG: sporulation protein, partial [Dehalococcoidia bacterium]|nr:sporulation protein [Dehalococcoidia bacterium]